MEGNTAVEMLGGFKSIFNRGKGILEPSSPHARNAALLPFLVYIYASESGHLQVLTSDFHSNTWHARFNCDQLNELKETLGFREGFSIFLQGLYKAFTADDVKIELGGPASAIGGKGATSAKIKATANFLGTPRDVCLSLELFKGRSANDAVGALALDLYEAFFTGICTSEIAQYQKCRMMHFLEEVHLWRSKCWILAVGWSRNCNVSLKHLCSYKKNAKILDAVVQGKANSVHFRPHAIPKETRLVWNEAQSSEPPTSGHPSVAMSTNSCLGHSLPASMQPELEAYPPFPVTAVAKHLKHSTSRRRRIGGSSNSSLKLAVQNSYARVAKQISNEKKDDNLTVTNVEESQVSDPLKACSLTGCSPETETVPEILDSASDKSKYRDIDTDILAKIEAGGENRSLKTDLWARRHYLEWRKFLGLPEKDIEELPLPEFAESLVKFFCMVKKHNGDLFPSDRYDESRAVKYKNKTSFRDTKCCGEKDVVDCLDKYFMSLPAKPLEGEPRRLFLAPIKRPTSNVWFRHQNIGARTLLKWYKKMCCLECHPELDSANCSSVQQSASLLRTSCQTAGNSRGSNSRTNLNISSADGSAIGQIRIAEKHSAEFENSVEISSESDEESVESKEDKEIELSVLDSHPETNSKDLTNHVSSEIDEISL